MAIIRA